MHSTPGVVVPRRLPVSHDHGHVASHVTPPVAQYKDNMVSMAAKQYKHNDMRDPVKSSGSSVAMDTADTGTASNDDVYYDGQCLCVCVCLSVCLSLCVCVCVYVCAYLYSSAL